LCEPIIANARIVLSSDFHHPPLTPCCPPPSYSPYRPYPSADRKDPPSSLGFPTQSAHSTPFGVPQELPRLATPSTTQPISQGLVSPSPSPFSQGPRHHPPGPRPPSPTHPQHELPPPVSSFSPPRHTKHSTQASPLTPSTPFQVLCSKHTAFQAPRVTKPPRFKFSAPSSTPTQDRHHQDHHPRSPAAVFNKWRAAPGPVPVSTQIPFQVPSQVRKVKSEARRQFKSPRPKFRSIDPSVLALPR
jgi:hypothetical protein